MCFQTELCLYILEAQSTERYITLIHFAALINNSFQLSQGVLVKVFPSLIKRRKTHFHNLPVGASVILGNNGFIWISPIINEDEDSAGGFVQNLEEVVPLAERETIARIRNCILALAQSKMMLYDTSIHYAFEESLKYKVSELLLPEAMQDVAELTQQRLAMLENA